jgi:acetyl-CoA acetyltransferase
MEQLAEASLAACTDAGVSIRDVDGIFCALATANMPPVSVAEYLGLVPRYLDGTYLGGASNVASIAKAALALETRQCDVALICYGSNQRSASGKLVSTSDSSPWETRFRPRYPVSHYALAAARHMHQFGTKREDLAEVALAARAWAALNPDALKRDPLTMDDVLSSRFISDPLTVRDCCLVTDGGGAAILMRSDRARDCPKPPVYVLGASTSVLHRDISAMPDLTSTAARISGRQALAAAGLEIEDIDVLNLYDAFTINVIMFLEDLGICPKGEGGPYVRGGALAPGGRKPVNTNGGGLSCNHPGMYGIFTIIESVRQLRREAGERQVANASFALAHGNGGVFTAQATAVFGREVP